MGLKLAPPLLPMEAQSVDRMPRGDVWQYEPKCQPLLAALGLAQLFARIG